MKSKFHTVIIDIELDDDFDSIELSNCILKSLRSDKMPNGFARVYAEPIDMDCLSKCACGTSRKDCIYHAPN